MRLLDETLRVADDSGNEAPDGLDHRHGRDLAAVEHVVPHADESHTRARSRVVDDALVDALVTTASEDQVLLGGELLRQGLGEDLTGRRREDDDGRRRLFRFARVEDAVEGFAPWLRSHDHARAATVWSVVDSAMTVEGVVAEIVDAEVDEAALPRPAEQGDIEHGEELRKDRHDVDAHLTIVCGQPRSIAPRRTTVAEDDSPHAGVAERATP
jgi:hypothetical protein